MRRSAKRGDRADAKNGASASQRRAPAAKTTSAARSAKPATTRAAKAPAGRKATPATARAAKAPAARKAKPAVNAAAKVAADVTAVAETTRSGAAPKAPRSSGAAPRRKVPPAGYAVPAARGRDSAGSGTADLLGTTIQAIAELAQIGLTVGRQTLQSMIDRLPKP